MKFDESLVAEILIFQFANFDYFLVKNYYLKSEEKNSLKSKSIKNDLF